MARANRSGYVLSASDTSIVLGMVNRGDRHHDIAAWFGVNQGRIKDAIDGKHFPTAKAAPNNQLPPSGPPGVKGRHLYAAVKKAIATLKKPASDAVAVLTALQDAMSKYDADE